MSHFVALLPDDDTRERLTRTLERFQAWGLPAQWVHPQDLHLTLCFLGELDELEENSSLAALDEVAGHLRKPVLQLAGLGAFGGGWIPKSIHAAITDPESGLAAIHDDLWAALDLRPNRPLHAHITLARPDRRPGSAGRRNWDDLLRTCAGANWGPANLAAVVFMASHEAQPGAPRYHALRQWPLH